jgi:tetratricopeptide (TPR) repeat protein
MALSLLLALALATEPAAPPVSTPETVEQPNASPTLPSDEPTERDTPTGADTAEPPSEVPTAELFAQAQHRLRIADYVGARLVLETAAERPDVDLEEVTYLRGVTYELDRDYPAALTLYTAGLDTFPSGHRSEDFAFRRAEIIGAMGSPDTALELLSPFVDTADERLPADRTKIRLVEGIWWIESGKTRGGMRRLAAALAAADPGHVRFYQAKARATVAAQWARDASALHLDTRERRQVRRLKQRGETMLAMERQVTEIALLDEPEWVLDGLQTLGDAYALLGDDLLSARMPRRLDPSLHDLYRQTVAEKAEVLLVKALNHYRRGIDLALRVGWKSRRVGELEASERRLRIRIEGLAR